jgi:hypothetical protein
MTSSTKCWPEWQIEDVALRIESAGGIDSLSPRMRDLLEHTGKCYRCGELLKAFRSMSERRGRQGRAQDVGSARDLEVLPLSPGPPDEGTTREVAATDDGDYDLAADTAIGTHPPQPLDHLRLTTQGLEFCVLIRSAEDGVAAIAWLIDLGGGSRAQGAEESQIGPRSGFCYLLRVGTTDYPFDETGRALLPGFPSGPCHLVRSKS